jgi:hypothetical protein
MIGSISGLDRIVDVPAEDRFTGYVAVKRQNALEEHAPSGVYRRPPHAD